MFDIQNAAFYQCDLKPGSLLNKAAFYKFFIHQRRSLGYIFKDRDGKKNGCGSKKQMPFLSTSSNRWDTSWGAGVVLPNKHICSVYLRKKLAANFLKIMNVSCPHIINYFPVIQTKKRHCELLVTFSTLSYILIVFIC